MRPLLSTGAQKKFAPPARNAGRKQCAASISRRARRPLRPACRPDFLCPPCRAAGKSSSPRRSGGRRAARQKGLRPSARIMPDGVPERARRAHVNAGHKPAARRKNALRKVRTGKARLSGGLTARKKTWRLPCLLMFCAYFAAAGPNGSNAAQGELTRARLSPLRRRRRGARRADRCGCSRRPDRPLPCAARTWERSR